MTKNNANRIQFLDSIRGIAAFMVFIQHIVLFLRREKLIDDKFDLMMGWTVDFLDFGKIGIVLFFILSGYLIPFSLKKNSTVLNFAIKRVFRLYPVFWVSIIFGVFVLWDPYPTVNTILANITMIPEILGFKSIVGIYWTLQIELIFYGMCVVLFLFNLLDQSGKIFKISIAFLVAAILFSIVRYSFNFKLPIALFLALSLMFFGYLWRIFQEQKGKLLKKRVVLYLSSFVILMLLISFLAYNRDYGHNETWYRYFLSYIISISLFVLFTTKCKINNYYIAYFGKISYSFYLFHIIVIHLVGAFKFDKSLENNIYYLFLCLVICTVVSMILFHQVEKRFISLGYKAVKRNN